MFSDVFLSITVHYSTNKEDKLQQSACHAQKVTSPYLVAPDVGTD
jgi:hypothetical protein